MGHGIAKNTFNQKLKLFWVHQLKARRFYNTQYDNQKLVNPWMH